MVKKYGMTEALGPVVYDEGNNQIFLGKDYGQVNNYSDDTGMRIDKEVERLMREAYAATEKILREHIDKLELVADTLLEKEKLSGEEFASLMENGYIEEPKAEETPEAPEAPEVISENADAESTTVIEATEERADNDTAPSDETPTTE